MPDTLFSPGHTACSGCGQSLAARLVLDAAGKNTIIANATGCLEVFSTGFPGSSWNVPFIHSLFENTPAVASGVEAALRYLKQIDSINVIAQGGDGSTADIGMGALSGMLERGHNVLYVCYDNEAYMNTGIQRSGLTPFSVDTTTSPAGKVSMGNPRPKKNLLEIVVAHGVSYAATASSGFPQDLQKKVKKAISLKGSKFIQVFVPCPLGWRAAPEKSNLIGKLVVETGLYPLVEYENGVLTQVRKIAKPKPVEEYLGLQGRFKHLFSSEEGKRQIKLIQDIANRNISRYNLLAESSPESVDVKASS
jgi:pyruvate ferredoxin oxidoreductase beta subunit